MDGFGPAEPVNVCVIPHKIFNSTRSSRKLSHDKVKLYIPDAFSMATTVTYIKL